MAAEVRTPLVLEAPLANGAPPSDVFTETLAERAERAAGFVHRHRMPMVLAAAALIVALGISAVLSSQRERNQRRMTDAYAEALEVLDAPLQRELDEERAALTARIAARAEARNHDAAKLADSADDSALDEDAEAVRLAEEEAEQQELERIGRQRKAYASPKERDEAARTAFAEVAKGAGNSPLGALATLEAAHAAERLHDIDDVRSRLQGLYESARQSDPLWSVVASRWATVLENQNDIPGALAVLQRFGQGEQRLLADEAGVQRARLLLLRNDTEAAREALQTVQLRFPDSPLDDEIQAMLLEMPAAGAADAAGAASSAGGNSLPGAPAASPDAPTP